MISEPFSIHFYKPGRTVPVPFAMQFSISEVVTPATDSNERAATVFVCSFTSLFLATRWLQRHAAKDKLYRVTSFAGKEVWN